MNEKLGIINDVLVLDSKCNLSYLMSQSEVVLYIEIMGFKLDFIYNFAGGGGGGGGGGGVSKRLNLIGY